MREESFFANGSEWILADFHLHTHKDKKFRFQNTTEYDDDSVFPNEFVRKLSAENIRLGVITNHNKFDRDEFRALQSKASKHDIFLLPGVELEIAEGAGNLHLIIVFSDEAAKGEDDIINIFLDTIFSPISRSTYTIANKPAEKKINNVIEELERIKKTYPVLDYFFIFAHVDQDKGLFHEMTLHNAAALLKKLELRNIPYALQKATTIDNLKALSAEGIDTPALVEGSDPSSVEGIGKSSRHCWLKIGAFTFEAVKLAILEHRDKISNTAPPRIKHSYIKRVSYSGGFLDGKAICFSPELNSIIGIRGSGKSALLETINYGLGLDTLNTRSDADYKRNLLDYALGSGGQISVEVVAADGNEYEIKRTINRAPEVYHNGNLERNLNITQTIINRPLFFGQKELSGRSEHFDMDFVDKLIGDKLSSIREAINSAKLRINDKIHEISRTNDTTSRKESLESSISSNEFKLKKFVELGLNDRFRKQTELNSDERKLNDLRNSYIDIEAKIEDLYGFFNTNSYTTKLSENSKDIEDRINELSDVIDSLKKDTERISRTMQGTLASLNLIIQDFIAEKSKCNDEFDRIKRQADAEIRAKGLDSAIKVEDYQILQTLVAKDKASLKAIEAIEAGRTKAEDELCGLLSELAELWRKEFQEIDKELKTINDSQHNIEIKAEFEGDRKSFKDYMMKMFRGTGVTSNEYSGIVQSYPDFIEMYKNKNEAFNFIRNERNRVAFKEAFDSNLLDILCYQVPNKFTILYKGSDITKLSLGQRASAMLLFILNQKNNDVIIIDQPEDDLDNQTIYDEVIKTIISLKPSTQFIFATHNANIPVLGDSEMVHCCSAEKNDGNAHINISSGSLDEPEMRKNIINVMEGGKAAFERRKEIYGLWNY